MEFDIAVLPGDGVGPEVITQALKVLQTVGEKFGHSFHLHDGLIGGVAIDALGTALNNETLMMCKQCDAVLLGAVGGSKWDDPQAKIHPEDGLLALRKGLRLFANLRPVKVFPMLVNSTNLKPEVVKGVDLVVVRELTGGIYFGQPKKQWRTPKGRQAVDTMA
jgi:3-isopropylmalate dehydrogenase